MTSGTEQAAQPDDLGGRSATPAVTLDPLRLNSVCRCNPLLGGSLPVPSVPSPVDSPRWNFGHRAPPPSVGAVPSLRRGINQTWSMDACLYQEWFNHSGSLLKILSLNIPRVALPAFISNALVSFLKTIPSIKIGRTKSKLSNEWLYVSRIYVQTL